MLENNSHGHKTFSCPWQGHIKIIPFLFGNVKNFLYLCYIGSGSVIQPKEYTPTCLYVSHKKVIHTPLLITFLK